MPRHQLSRKRVASEDYESDGGFVEDAPKAKKSKRSDGKAEVNLAMQKDDEGNAFWEISRQRRVQVSDFKGTTMVGIREFYEKDGKTLPGKKGISLSIDQFTAFIKVLPQIDRALKLKGVELPRPSFDDTSAEAVEQGERDTYLAKKRVEEDSEAEAQPKMESALSKAKRKKNHEATSDEDED